MDPQRLRRFAEALTRADRSRDGARLCVTVTYSGNPERYDEWAPLRMEDFLEDGIRDPGFGSGPIRYADIDALFVHASLNTPPGYALSPEALETYANKYQMLLGLVRDMDDLRIDATGIATQ